MYTLMYSEIQRSFGLERDGYLRGRYGSLQVKKRRQFPPRAQRMQVFR